MIVFDREHNANIEWKLTGEVYDRVSCYDWEELLVGEDQYGECYTASGIVSCGEIQEIHDIEMVHTVEKGLNY